MKILTFDGLLSSMTVKGSIIGAVVVVVVAPTLLVVCKFGVFIGDSIIDADPFVAMVICSHAVIQHCSSFLDQLGQFPACAFVFWVLLDVVHLQNYLLAHDCTLNGCTSTV